MPEIRFDTYYRYDDMTRILQDCVAEYPSLCRLESMGQSYEGRDIWVLILTNFETGPDAEKPAFWVDGNIHATEVSPSTAALYLIDKLLTNYGKDERITYALDSRAFYVVPRLNPDGAEWALADTPRFIRSSVRPYPRQDQLDGLIQEDIDGDGRILQMRLKDPHGSRKIHPDEPRLMMQREPDDPPGGNYYRLLPEGRIQNYDGVLIKMAPALQGLDINRNFPINWEVGERGAGTHPGGEPETRAAIEYVVNHPNITGSISYHTFSGVHLRPPTKDPENQMDQNDLRAYKRIGAKATELTGYPSVSVYHDFKYDPNQFIKGTFHDWLYEQQGVFGWTTEIWSVQSQAGIKDYKFIEWFTEHPLEHDLQIIKWFDEALDGEGIIDWYEFDHPELGKVELGGWDTMHTWRNPPFKLLEKEVAPLADHAIWQCLVSPKLELLSLEATPHGDAHLIRLVLHNTGWLPTSVTSRAAKTGVAKPLEIDLELPENAKLLAGEKKSFHGQLPGRNHKGMFALWSSDDTAERLQVEWVVQVPAGTPIQITAKHDRAGTVRASITL